MFLFLPLNEQLYTLFSSSRVQFKVQTNYDINFFFTIWHVLLKAFIGQRLLDEQDDASLLQQYILVLFMAKVKVQI